jgi:hypothetical protein
MRQQIIKSMAIAVLLLIALPVAASAEVSNTRITSGPTGVIHTDSATFTFTSPLDGGFECRFDSGDWESCKSPQTYSLLASGRHVFRVRALNRPGHPDPTPSVAIFRVEIEPPETTITEGPSGAIAANLAIFSFESSQPGGFECRLDSTDAAAWSPCSSPQAYTPLPDGAHTFEVRAVNAFSEVDETPAVADFSVDTTPPDTTIVSGPTGTVDTGSVSFSFTASEEGSFECRLDSGPWAPCSSPQGYSLGDGPHAFEVRAADALGNVDPTPALSSFTVNTAPILFTAPTGPPLPVAGETFNLELIKGTVELVCPGESELSRLIDFKQIPMGCLINTRNGVANLTASKGSSGDLQDADFWGGVFVVTQDPGDNRAVDLKLVGKRMCERRGSAKKGAATTSRTRRGGGRRVWGSGKGNYKTSGSYGSATVRGTTWLVADRCDGSTLFKVADGTVWVDDFVKDKLLTLTAGEQYIAKSSVPRLNPDLLP